MRLSTQQEGREKARHYIPASDSDVAAMKQAVGVNHLAELYSHIAPEVKFVGGPDLHGELDYAAAEERMRAMAARNRSALSFIGDGLPDFSTDPIVDYVSGLRNLTTSYTPYQPERSQGTLYCHWVYQCLMAELTGFEAVNSSLYDRSTAIFEGMAMAQRLSRTGNVILLPEALYPGDVEVIETLAEHTPIRIEKLPLDATTGRIDMVALAARATALGKDLAGIVAPQVNCLGLLEDVDAISDLAADCAAAFIAVIDPLLLATGGLKTPDTFGRNGATIIAGEGQHLAIAPNFGGPGLGVFAVRYNATRRNDVRQTPGRYIGKARDNQGRDCRVMVMSTREQHIRKDKATSNICSNQAFLATLAGASMLARGSEGLARQIATARRNAEAAVAALTAIAGVRLAFADAAFFNEVTLELSKPVADLLAHCRAAGIHAGVDVSTRVSGGRQLLKLSFSDKQAAADVSRLADTVASYMGGGCQAAQAVPALVQGQLRSGSPSIPRIETAELQEWYRKLGELNATPDAAPYPLGSCTMKYNPELNELTANLPGFTQVHPQAPVEDAQGCLELLYETQEWFKAITGLAAVTTQPVAGAQGELVGIKLFQAYHAANGEADTRDIILLPRSAHGTNFATASVAGFQPGKDGAGIILLEADDQGRIDLAGFEATVSKFGHRISGIMVTNPNTSGLFETDFKRVADAVHAVGGLVYMDGANMNAIAGWVNLGALGVDAVHNNLHKTWTIPHGGGGPGDAIVAVSDRLADFLPGWQIEQVDGQFRPVRPVRSIGSFHRHWGNFAHKIRAFTYLIRLGRQGVPRMSAMAVLAARYVFERVRTDYLPLPRHSTQPRMHEFIVTLKDEDFHRIEQDGVQRPNIMAGMGKLFLDFGYHAPTMSWPEANGMMVEPTESYTQAELDRFADAMLSILDVVRARPHALTRAPFFMPVGRIDEVSANRSPVLNDILTGLPEAPKAPAEMFELDKLPIDQLRQQVIAKASEG